jgi:hypothetical protein
VFKRTIVITAPGFFSSAGGRCGAFGLATPVTSPAKGRQPLDLIESLWELVVMDFSRFQHSDPLRVPIADDFDYSHPAAVVPVPLTHCECPRATSCDASGARQSIRPPSVTANVRTMTPCFLPLCVSRSGRPQSLGAHLQNPAAECVVFTRQSIQLPSVIARTSSASGAFW